MSLRLIDFDVLQKNYIISGTMILASLLCILCLLFYIMRTASIYITNKRRYLQITFADKRFLQLTKSKTLRDYLRKKYKIIYHVNYDAKKR